MKLTLQFALLLITEGADFTEQVGYLLFGLSFHYRSEGRLSAISCQVILYHLLMGHFSVAIRSLACVEHPHFWQRPVFTKPDSSQNSQPLQVSSRALKVSGSAVWKPEDIKLDKEPPRFCIFPPKLNG